MSLLKIALLGPPEVYHGERRFAFPERKTLALLAYLAAMGTVQERQKLTVLFWPESDMAHGRTTLRINLLHLRQALEDDRADHAPHMLITRAAFGLDREAGLDLDVDL